MPVLKRFNPPAFLDDLETDELKQGWSEQINTWMEGEINADPSVVQGGRTPLKQFFNPLKKPFDQTATHVNVSWIAFPKRVSGHNDTARWQKADSDRDLQDEYLEWSVLREGDNITSVTFTCEGPEYWEYLGANQPEKTFELIKSLNKPLFDEAEMNWFFIKDKDGKWAYDRTNKYNNNTNTGGIINLFQENNTLSAEVDIAAQATVIRQSAGKMITDQDKLICCSKYGDPYRNSDPTIGGQINAKARLGWTISVADPVALYMQSFSTATLQLDTSGNRDGTNTQNIPKPWIELQRGSDLGGKIPLALRLRICNNTGLKTDDGSRLLDVSDIYDSAKQTNIMFGSQFADYISMGVAAVAGPTVPPPTLADALPCFDPAQATPHAVAFINSSEHQAQGGKSARVHSRRTG